MSYPRSSINDYPEHLNPFYEGNQKPKFWKIGKVKRSSSFGEALRNTLLFKSIRGKKKKQQINTPSSPPELRRNEAQVHVQYRQTLPTIVSPSPSLPRTPVSVPLPRSRFSERVARPYTHQGVGTNENSLNPFEEEVPKESSSRHKRRKRKAPLPPNSVTSHGTLSICSTHNSSNWSLTSGATDMSAYSDNENLSTDVIDPSISVNISNIVKEIEKFAEEDKDKSSELGIIDIPDVVSSSIEVTVPSKDCDQPIDENFNVVPEICDKDTVEDTCPDVLYNTNCEIDVVEKTVSDVNNEMRKTSVNDSLTNLINSIELNNNDNPLDDKSDSLTNIINSINMVENECYVPPVSVTKDEVAVIRSFNLDDTDEEQNRKKSTMVSNVAIT